MEDPSSDRLAGISPARSNAVERDNNKACELPISYTNFALSYVLRDIAWSFINRQACRQLAPDLDENHRRIDVLAEQVSHGGDVCAVLCLHDRPLQGCVLNRRKVVAHEFVDATRVHAG